MPEGAIKTTHHGYSAAAPHNRPHVSEKETFITKLVPFAYL